MIIIDTVDNLIDASSSMLKRLIRRMQVLLRGFIRKHSAEDGGDIPTPEQLSVITTTIVRYRLAKEFKVPNLDPFKGTISFKDSADDPEKKKECFEKIMKNKEFIIFCKKTFGVELKVEEISPSKNSIVFTVS